jgi:hypothetical protein
LTNIYIYIYRNKLDYLPALRYKSYQFFLKNYSCIVNMFSRRKKILNYVEINPICLSQLDKFKNKLDN